MANIYLSLVLAPLVGSIIAGLFGKQIGRANAHRITILGVAIACALSIYVFYQHVYAGVADYNATVYQWATFGNLSLEIGFLVDNLTAMMLVVVTFVSLMVHVYTIGYMVEDPGYQRFFSYISLFTFSMLMLVMSNNFLQLFFGWEAVGLVSYLLIGFWFKKPTATYANLKAFLVNRVGDFGFLLGIAGVLYYFGSLDYKQVFAAVPAVAEAGTTLALFSGAEWSVITIIAICLFIGAMGKSAQVPLHVWLPDSMEGPTPISALIHAATMVTAGVFMVTRMSPIFELSDVALSFVLVIGSITALFMGFMGVIQNDIKRVVAYSTLSQLGYMVVALGASAYAAGVFHLMTHAFFKALLFLAAGSVIIGLHHKQDIRQMGGISKYMRITWITSLIGSLALIGTPFFSGFYSKDAIIEAVHSSTIAGSGFANFAVLTGVFFTALYSFRMFFLVFHTDERMDQHTKEHLHECPKVVTWPLIALAIPSVVVGYLFVEPMLVGDFFKTAIPVMKHTGVTEVAKVIEEYGPAGFALHAIQTLPFWLMLAGVATAWVCWVWKPEVATWFREKFALIHRILDKKYYCDDFNQAVFAEGTLKAGTQLSKHVDSGLIDGVVVNGSANLVGRISTAIRGIQTGYLNHYAFAMILGVLAMIIYLFLKV